MLYVLKDPFLNTWCFACIGYAVSSFLLVFPSLLVLLFPGRPLCCVRCISWWCGPRRPGVVGVWRYASRPWHGPSAAERLGKGPLSDSFSFHNYCVWDYKAHFLTSWNFPLGEVEVFFCICVSQPGPCTQEVLNVSLPPSVSTFFTLRLISGNLARCCLC